MLPEGTRATIVLLYQILSSATALTAVMSPDGNITCKDNIAEKSDKVLPCT